MDDETTSSTDNAICENEFMRITPTVNSIAINEPGVQKAGCPMVSVDTANSYPVVMTIDYGTACVDSFDQRTRSGKILCTFSGPWNQPGTTVTIDFQNYMVSVGAGMVNYDADITLSRVDSITFSKTVSNGRCWNANWDIGWSSTRTIKWINGSQTPADRSDDIVSITGDAAGTNREGRAYTANIEQSIIKDAACKWIKQGRFTLTPSGKATRTVDFGNGACDNQATISINGNTFPFTMN